MHQILEIFGFHVVKSRPLMGLTTKVIFIIRCTAAIYKRQRIRAIFIDEQEAFFKASNTKLI